MNKNELREKIRLWWEYNQKMAQFAEGRYFAEQIVDWESGFTNHTKDGWVPTNPQLVVSKAKDIQEGLSIRLESEGNFIDGILNLKTGQWVEKEIFGDTTGSFVLRGASME